MVMRLYSGRGRLNSQKHGGRGNGREKGRRSVASILWRGRSKIIISCPHFSAIPVSVLYRNRRLDRGMRVIADKLKIFEFEFVNVFNGRIELHLRERTRRAGELEL